jgi:type II secretory ATPase GspE/PulE/Tfp pilus assembly ATPase PilB-like protein
MQNIDEIKIKKDIPDVIDYVNKTFDSAIADNVSDIHVETLKNYLLIRFRKD